MAYEWAKPGVKCVFLGHRSKERSVKSLTKGNVYTIRETKMGYLGDGSYVSSLMLTEVVNDVSPDGKEWAYYVGLFRPIVTKTQEQDVEMFLRLANPSPLERLDRLAEELDSLYND